jgi:hypothetical protein
MKKCFSELIREMRSVPSRGSVGSGVRYASACRSDYMSDWQDLDIRFSRVIDKLKHVGHPTLPRDGTDLIATSTRDR